MTQGDLLKFLNETEDVLIIPVGGGCPETVAKILVETGIKCLQ